jgi:hypothetical protein
MALDNLDPNIPLQAGQIQIGGPQQQNAFAQLYMRQMQLRQAQQSENALRALYSDPSNLDQNQRPTANAMAQLGARSPQAMLNLQNQFAQMDERNFRGKLLQSEASEKWSKAGYGILKSGISAYEDTFHATNDERRARQAATDTIAEQTAAAKADGSLPQNYIDRINSQPFDPVKWRAMAAGYEAKQTKPMTPYQAQELGIQKGRLGLEAERLKGEEDTRAETAQRDRNREDIERAKLDQDKLAPSKEYAVIDKDGQVLDRVAGREKTKGGPPVRFDGTPIEAPPGGKIELSTKAGGGRQAAAQAMAMLNAGNEAAASVANLVDLPVSATSGWFKGLTSASAEHLSENIKRGLAGYVNDRDARSLQISWQGIGRALATLEAAGRATGLVGLQKQAETLQPQKGDTNLNVLRSYAEIRQIVDRSVETMKSSPDVSKEQKALMDKIRDEVKTSVPWTVKDINALERGDDKTVSQFAEKMKAAGASSGQPAAPKAATGKAGGLDVTEEEYNKLPSGAAYTMPGDSTVRYKR